MTEKQWMKDFIERYGRETAKVPGWMLKSNVAQDKPDSKKSSTKK